MALSPTMLHRLSRRVGSCDFLQYRQLVALQKRLEESGYRVHTAIDGLRALDALTTRQRFGVIISGLNMPGMNGIDLLKRVRREYPNLPFILMSAGASEERVAEALQLGANQLVPKPLNYHALLAAIEEACR